MRSRKYRIINGVVIGLLVLIFLTVNVAMVVLFDFFTFVTNNMGLDISAPAAVQAKAETSDLVAQITAEGIVLLRNENDTLPLQKGNINLFGWATTNLVVGGTGGSGGTDGADVTIRDSFELAGFAVNDELYTMYTGYQGGRKLLKTPQERAYHLYSPYWDLPEPSIDDGKYYTPELLENAKNFSDVAVFTMGRMGGEGIDLPEGYLSMTEAEKALAKYLVDNYSQVIVILNTNNVMEIGYLEEIGVGAIIYMPGTGSEGCISLGRIVSGEINPSGHTVDTFAYDHKSAPNYYYANRQGTMTYAEYAYEKNQANKFFYVDYVEGIYVGYKYYETAAAEGFIDYDSTVQYPFGHGLSYTTFTQEVTEVRGDLNSERIEIDVRVTNTGDRAGKEVVQIYATPEYHRGGIEKAHVDLVGFSKTALLQPGEAQTVTIEVDPYEIASYDWNDANGDGRTGYVLEAGGYELKLMRNSHELIAVAATFELPENIYIDSDPVTGTEIRNLFDDAAGQEETQPVVYLSRGDFAGTWPASKENPTMGSNYGLVGRSVSAAVAVAIDQKKNPVWESDPDARLIITGAKNGLTVQDVAGLDYEDPEYRGIWEQLLDQLTVDEMVRIAQRSIFRTPAIASVGLNNSVMSDGPQGLNAWMSGVIAGHPVAGASYPCETYIALTWNTDLAAQQGEYLAREARAASVAACLAPAVNIHRTPYSGRNFEYYSEDGFLSGKMAAETVAGAKSAGVIMFVKHFALNDQETHRGEFFTSLFTWSNEQAIREVYVKPFEIAVKEGGAVAVMSSFNRIGATTASASWPLLTGLLRNEWGFRGTVISDMYDGARANEWWMIGEQGIRAGQDLYIQSLGTPQKYDTSDYTTLNGLRNVAKHVIYTMSFTDIIPAKMTPKWFYIALPIDILAGVGLVFYMKSYVRNVRGKKKKKPV